MRIVEFLYEIDDREEGKREGEGDRDRDFGERGRATQGWEKMA